LFSILSSVLPANQTPSNNRALNLYAAVKQRVVKVLMWWPNNLAQQLLKHVKT